MVCICQSQSVLTTPSFSYLCGFFFWVSPSFSQLREPESDPRTHEGKRKKERRKGTANWSIKGDSNEMWLTSGDIVAGLPVLQKSGVDFKEFQRFQFSLWYFSFKHSVSINLDNFVFSWSYICLFSCDQSSHSRGISYSLAARTTVIGSISSLKRVSWVFSSALLCVSGSYLSVWPVPWVLIHSSGMRDD